MVEGPVRYELRDGIATLVMDDAKANALSHIMMDALSRGFSRAESEAKAVVLSGRPGRFCAGFDLKVMMSGPDNARALVTAGADLLMRIYQFPMPVVIACTGHAMAGGALLVLVGDTRVGTEGDYKIGLNEVSIGMTLPLLAQELARDRLDPRRLVAATVQATVYSPLEAINVGFLDRVATPTHLQEDARTEAARLMALPAAAYAGTKRRLRAATVALIRDTLEQDMLELTAPQ